MAGNTGPEYFGTVIARIGYQRIGRRAFQRRSDRLTRQRVPASDCAVCAAGQQLRTGRQERHGPDRGARACQRSQDAPPLAIDDRHGSADARSRDHCPIRRDRQRDDRCWTGLDFADLLGPDGQKVHLAVGTARRDLSVRRDRNGVKRRRQRDDIRRALWQWPDPDREIITDADQRFPVRREGNAVNVLRMAFQHALHTDTERPKPHGAVPGCGCQHRTVGRHGKRRNRPASEYGLSQPSPPLFFQIAIIRDAAILQEDDRIHRVGMEAKNLLGGFRRERPPDRRCVEAAGPDALTIGRDRKRPNRPTVAGELSQRSFDIQRQRGGNRAETQAPIHCYPSLWWRPAAA